MSLVPPPDGPRDGRSRRAAGARGAIGLFCTVLLGTGPGEARTDAPHEAPAVARLAVELDPPEITVGDRVAAKITLVWSGPAPPTEPRFPSWQESWGTAEVLEVGGVAAVADHGGRRIYRQTVILTAFEVGAVRLPPISVEVPLDAGKRTIALAGENGFVVRSVLPENALELGPRAAAPLRAPDADRRVPLTLGALAAGCLLLAWHLRRRLRRAVAGPAAEPRLQPLEELLANLRQLDTAAAEPTHTALSLGLRRYLGRRLGFAAAESTTSEIRRRLRRTPIPSEVARGTVHLLGDCDRVKFARQQIDPLSTEGRLQRVRALARAVEASLTPAEPRTESAG